MLFFIEAQLNNLETYSPFSRFKESLDPLGFDNDTVYPNNIVPRYFPLQLE